MRLHSEVYEDMDFIPSIPDGERIRFDIQHVSGVRKLRLQHKTKRLVSHPLTMVALVWLVMAVLLAFEVWR